MEVKDVVCEEDYVVGKEDYVIGKESCVKFQGW
jgi:hypothetical protein